MRSIYFFLYKEFKQIFRDKGMLPIIFIMPMIQLVLLTFAADYEIKNLKLFWVDQDQSSSSRLLRSKFEASSYFILSGSSMDTHTGDKAIEHDEADLMLVLPKNFEKNLLNNRINNVENTARYKSKYASIQLIINAVDGMKAGLGNAYAQAVIQDFRRQLIEDYAVKTSAKISPQPQLNIRYSHWYNPEMDYKTFMVPGILALLVTMVGGFLSGMNIVREKELGTIEQLNVSPLKKQHFIIGKLLPFWFIAMFEMTVGLVIARLLYDLPMLGSLGLLYAFASIYLLVILGMGLLISTITETQQQAMFITWFFLVIFILMGGLFTAIENMPGWAQQITYANPVRYFIEVLRMILLKGASWTEVAFHFKAITFFAILVNGLAVWRYKKTV